MANETTLITDSGLVTARVFAGLKDITFTLSQFGEDIASTTTSFDTATVPTGLTPVAGDSPTPTYEFGGQTYQPSRASDTKVLLTGDGTGGFWVIYARNFTNTTENFRDPRVFEPVILHFGADLMQIGTTQVLDPLISTNEARPFTLVPTLLPVDGSTMPDLVLFFGSGNPGLSDPDFDQPADPPLQFVRIDATTGTLMQTDLGLRAAPEIVTPVTESGTDILRVRSFFNDDTAFPFDPRYSLITDHNSATGDLIRIVSTGSPTRPDAITGYIFDDRLDGTDQGDLIFGLSGDDTLLGRGGDDTLFGGNGNDMMAGANGNDFVSGDDGNDIIGGGLGNDTLRGGFGDDELRAGQGDDSVYGGTGRDSLGGGTGNDRLFASDGADELAGGPGADILWGQRGNDLMGGGTQSDTLIGGYGNDSLFAGTGNDSLYGDDLNDLFNGGADDLNGGRGDDTLFGEVGNDTLDGGFGDDSMTGGAGFDSFVFTRFTTNETDIITDFTTFEDRITLTGVAGDTDADRFSALTITDALADGAIAAAISYGGHTILITGLDAGDILVSDFLFV